MKHILKLIAFGLVFNPNVFAQTVSPTETDATVIMKAVDERDEGDRASGTLSLQVTDGKGRSRSRSLKMWSKKFDQGRKQMMIFSDPADVAGTGLLSVDYDAGRREDDQWLYLPSLKKATRISSGEKSGSFMGTDLTYADMTTRDPADFTYSMDKPSVKVGDEDCWLIIAKPATAEVQKETGYLKSKIWVSKSNLMVRQIKAYVLEGRKLKYIRFDDIKQIDGIWMAHTISARTMKKRKVESTTVLSFSEYKLNDDTVVDTLFTQQRLQQGI